VEKNCSFLNDGFFMMFITLFSLLSYKSNC